jgi:hypothetical protein
MTLRIPAAAIVLLAFACAPETDRAFVSASVRASDALVVVSQCSFFASGDKVEVCHATGSASNPYVSINVSTTACEKGHASHEGDYVNWNGGACDGPCAPQTCASLGRSCGAAPDGCGGTLDCGGCADGQTCNSEGTCGGKCAPPPNAACRASACCADGAAQFVCCQGPLDGSAPLFVERHCTGKGVCTNGKTFPSCGTQLGDITCPLGSSAAIDASGNAGCKNDCGFVGPGGCSVCSVTPWKASCSSDWTGEICATSHQ